MKIGLKSKIQMQSWIIKSTFIYDKQEGCKRLIQGFLMKKGRLSRVGIRRRTQVDDRLNTEWWIRETRKMR